MHHLAHLRSTTPLHSVETITAPLTPDVPFCQLSPADEKILVDEDTPNNNPHEGLPRWPGLSSATHLLRALDLFGTAVFATCGSLAAALAGCDLLGCIIVGCITAVGGGTWRDILLLHQPPFWVVEVEYLVMPAVVAAAVFFLWGFIPPGQTVLGASLKLANGDGGVLLDWGDAIGIGVATVIGAMNGLRHDCPAVISALCGLVTATFGGLTRDVVLNRPVRILYSHAEVYAVIPLTGAAVYLGLRHAAPRRQTLRIAGCVALVIVLRHQAWTHGWRLPVWNNVKS
ncbi:Aste57867_1356 [Aphanomyces stellatus]|uniref:Aste57867_1356 protein n=1 Tax=Aphanomyces stellatus TaxID=120398 RepID=A0A485K7N9_9STRA|nr:hypothetical protein As57867_001355 [Aphanomyces stellatus]VFT78575.1 Aste57867_1356 [Aphanomyces stellatus]